LVTGPTGTECLLESEMSADQLRAEVGMMKLEKLIAARETVSDAVLSIPEKEIIARYEKLYSGLVSDVMREFALLDQSVPGSIQALVPGPVVAGFAFTVKSAPNVKITGEMSFRATMLEELGEDHFVMWDSSQDEKGTMWGGVMTATAKKMGVKAACIDGGIRDTAQIIPAEFPVFYRYRSPNGSLGRCLITHYQIPIKIGDVTIKPGDLIVGDGDGVVVVPRDICVDVLLRAEEMHAGEMKIFSWVEQGDSISEITGKGGYF